jgi:hypothetical protein
VTENEKPLKVVFAPGCFDDFEGTQEELDDLINEITTMAEDGTLLEKSQPLDIDTLIDGLDDDEIMQLLTELGLDDLDDLDDDDEYIPQVANSDTKKLH